MDSYIEGNGIYGIESLKNSVNEIRFFSFSTNASFNFKAFLTNFSDQYKSNWTAQEVYGRMDPISIYKNTVRTITIAFDVPSSNIFEADINAKNADQLVRALYPVYNEYNSKLGTALIGSPPLFKIKFANLIANTTKEVSSDDPLDSGLLGWIDGFSFKPELESGFFSENSSLVDAYLEKDRNSNYKQINMLYPKLFNVGFTFNVIHEHPLGTKSQGQFKVTRVKEGSRTFSHFYEQTPFNPPLANEAPAQENQVIAPKTLSEESKKTTLLYSIPRGSQGSAFQTIDASDTATLRAYSKEVQRLGEQTRKNNNEQ